MHFSGFDGGGGQLWVYSLPATRGGSQIEGPFTGKGVFGDGDVWTGVIESSTVVIEFVEAAPNAAPSLLPFRIEGIVHLWTAASLPRQRLIMPVSAEAGRPENIAAYCDLDVSCYAAYKTLATAVEEIEFQGDDGGYYLCSGSMINTQPLSFKSYFLTANHCISDNAEAHSLVVHFLYQTSDCKGVPPSISTVPTVLGGTFLAGADIKQGDYSLVLLSAPAPGGVNFLGWNTADPNIGDPVTGISHPMGSWTRIAFGNRLADQDVDVDGATAPGSLYYNVNWLQGRTEGGSSGSPLLNASNQLIGTLTYGPGIPDGETICDVNPENAGYARFSDAYPAIQSFLNDVAPPNLNALPASLSFTVNNGAYVGVSQAAFTIATASTIPVSFTLTATQPWIKLSATSGTVVSTGPAVQITVTLDLTYFTKSAVSQGAVMMSSGTLTPISVAISVNATVSAAKVSLSVNPNPVYQGTPDVDGYSWFYNVTLTESAGVSAQVTTFKIAGTDDSRFIAADFGSTQLPANGTLTASLRSMLTSTPVNRTFEADGVDANGSPWTATVTVPFMGRAAHAILALQSAPQLIRQNPNSSDCPWAQQLVLSESGGFAGIITGFTSTAGALPNSIASYWGTTQLSADGTLRANVCWMEINPPDTRTLQVTVADSSGTIDTACVTASFTGPAAASATASASSPSVLLTAAANYGATATATVNFTPGSNSAPWTGSLVFPSFLGSSWLTVAPLSGTGPAVLTVTAAPGLASGTYNATLVLESDSSVPELLDIAIQFTVGASATGPVINPAGMLNNATHAAGAVAPGSILEMYGLRMATGTQSAPSTPLPTTLQGAAVTINNRPAPLFYVSPGQINLQVPYETELGNATVSLTVNGQSTQQQLQVTATAPGIYMSDGVNVTPVITIARGGVGVLYVTGQGAVMPPMADGAVNDITTPLQNLPTPIATVGVTVGGVPATIQFAGIPYFLAGIMQVNYQVAAATPTGVQPVVVQVGTSLSQPVNVQVQ